MRPEVATMYEVLALMSDCGIMGDYVVPQDDAEEMDPPLPAREQRFFDGWAQYKLMLCDTLGIQRQDDKCMYEDVRRVAELFGSTRTYKNDSLQGLKSMMKLIASEECDSYVRLMGLRAMRAILYLQPDADVRKSEKDEEFRRFLENEPPLAAAKKPRDKAFSELQSTIALLGGVDVVVNCVESTSLDVKLAALQLGVTMLESGNLRVQDR